LRASLVAQARGNSPRFGVSSMSAGRSASGSMPAWLTSASRRGEPEASTNLARPITAGLFVGAATRPSPRQAPSGANRNFCCSRSLEAIRDATLGEVVGRHLHQHLVAGEHADTVLAHAARGVGDDFVLILELDAEGGVREQLRDDTGKFQEFFLHHSLPGIAGIRLRQGPKSGRKFARNVADDGPFDNWRS